MVKGCGYWSIPNLQWHGGAGGGTPTTLSEGAVWVEVCKGTQ